MKVQRPVEGEEFTDTKMRICLIEATRVSEDDDAMLERIAKLEQRMDSVIPELATKADLHKGLSEMKVWMIGTVMAILMVTAALGMFLLGGIRSVEHAPTARTGPR